MRIYGTEVTVLISVEGLIGIIVNFREILAEQPRVSMHF